MNSLNVLLSADGVICFFSFVSIKMWPALLKLKILYRGKNCNKIQTEKECLDEYCDWVGRTMSPKIPCKHSKDNLAAQFRHHFSKLKFSNDRNYVFENRFKKLQHNMKEYTLECKRSINEWMGAAGQFLASGDIPTIRQTLYEIYPRKQRQEMSEDLKIKLKNEGLQTYRNLYDCAHAINLEQNFLFRGMSSSGFEFAEIELLTATSMSIQNTLYELYASKEIIIIHIPKQLVFGLIVRDYIEVVGGNEEDSEILLLNPRVSKYKDDDPMVLNIKEQLRSEDPSISKKTIHIYEYLGYYPIEEKPTDDVVELGLFWVDTSAIIPKYYDSYDEPNTIKYLKKEFIRYRQLSTWPESKYEK